jgi:hypothetical protein
VLIQYWHVVVTGVQQYQDANVPVNDQRQADVEDRGLMQDKALNVYPVRVAVVELGNDFTGFPDRLCRQRPTLRSQWYEHVCYGNEQSFRGGE